MTVEHAQGSILELVGAVPWEWLAGCRVCGVPHGYRTQTRGKLPVMTWDAVNGHTYVPRLPRGLVDALLVEWKTEEGSDVVVAAGE
jgi:hypothetical protein